MSWEDRPASTQVALLRGVNVGGANRVAMAELRAAVSAAGLENVRTHLQSGNLLADGDPGVLAAAIRTVIDVPCVIREARGLDAVISANPFSAEAAEDPRRLQVTFWDGDPPTEWPAALQARCASAERVVVDGRVAYSWHPEGMARSKLALALTPTGATVTARNWNTVLALAELARA